MQELEIARATVAFFRGRVKSIAELDPKTLAALITDLGSPQFPVRQKATEALEKFGELAEPALRQALAKQPELDLARRLEGILKKLQGAPVSADELQMLRALEVLERIGNPEAQQVLAEIAKGAVGALRTRDARTALERLKERQD
jgi:HEAT repeat protein